MWKKKDVRRFKGLCRGKAEEGWGGFKKQGMIPHVVPTCTLTTLNLIQERQNVIVAGTMGFLPRSLSNLATNGNLEA